MNRNDLKRIRSKLVELLHEVDVALGDQPRRRAVYSADPVRVMRFVDLMRSRMMLREVSDDITHTEKMALAQILKGRGWTKRQVRLDGVQGYYWFEPGDHMAGGAPDGQ